LEKFGNLPSQTRVARKMIELGLAIGEGGRVMCGEVEVKEVSLGRAAGVDRRVVRATINSIRSDAKLSKLFAGIRPAGSFLKDVAHELGFGAVELEANAKKAGIIAAATGLLARRKISIRQVYAKDPELFENPTLVIITEKPVPGNLLAAFSKIPGVKKVSLL